MPLSSSVTAATAAAVASCGLVEINHRMDADGKQCFVQAIAWDWFGSESTWHAQGWVMVDDWRRDSDGVTIWTGSGERIKVHCKFFRETWTVHDPEVEDRNKFPCKYRRKVW